MTKAKETPLQKQYNQIKGKYPDALLLFRVGDFYETFGDDAIKASKILGIVLTKRGAGSTSETALAGFPHHALQTYLPKLVRAGARVAICDQLEDPKMTKKIVKRGVTELVTPGVALNDGVLEDKTNNFLAALYLSKNSCGLSFLDISTGEFLAAQGSVEYVANQLQHFQPKEVLIAKGQKKDIQNNFGQQYRFFVLEDWVFQTDYALEKLTDHFKTKSLKGFGVEGLAEGVVASGAIMHYLSETHHAKRHHITSLQRIVKDEVLWMDRFTMRNLELLSANSPEGVSLLEVIDKTVSPMGARMLRRWLAQPLVNKANIELRHLSVGYLKSATGLCASLQADIKSMGDLERLVAKVATAKITPRELLQLGHALVGLAPIKENLVIVPLEALQQLTASLTDCHEAKSLIQETLHAEAPVLISKGHVIADGVSPELDELRRVAHGGKAFLEDLLNRETERTQIPSLKISFNNVFGYYLEVRNAHKDKVPDDWVRKQTLVNAERYITEELKTYEQKILGAEEKIGLIEQQIYTQLLTDLQPHLSEIQANARSLAQLDCLCGFAVLAQKNNYCQPILNDTKNLEIFGGRHPVIEQQLPPEKPFISNDLVLHPDEQQLVMITGPNMSGKSAILRQAALIVLMAQMGSFVPADRVEMGLVDRLFTRVGASDNISMGESTFMVEMNETASILNTLSDRSLILLDEIGRGTSTYDGISIAWAIAEFLHEHPHRPKTLFATHYHELNRMADRFERIKNYNVSVKELEDQVLFLRKLVAGGSAHSFGIHVAKMAGMPQLVITKAQALLKKLESSREEVSPKASALNDAEAMQLSFFQLDDPLLEQLRDEILRTDIDRLTPVEALMKLNEIRRMLSVKKNS